MTTKHITILSLLAVVALVACSSDDGERPVNVIEGMWGGEHVELTTDGMGTTVEYDCGLAEIVGRLKVDAHGNVAAEGTYTRDVGGPIGPGWEPEVHTAQFRGRVSGDVLTLTIELKDTDRNFGTHTLRRDERGDLYKCL